MLRLWIIPFVFVCISSAARMQTQESAGGITHVVRSGDNLSQIALAYGVRVEEILDLNGLDPLDLLQPGQTLVIVAAQPAGESEAAPGGDAQAADAPIERTLPAIAAPAPIIEADAPPFDPTRFDAAVCLGMFGDDNQNGALDPGESYLAAGGIILKDEAGGEAANYTTDGLSEPFCIEDLAPMIYIVKAAAPDGYGLTASPSLHVNLEDGGRVSAHFGAKQGLAAAVIPTAAPRKIEDALEPMADGDSLLMELSGLFVIGLAGIVLFGGLFAALLIRMR